MLLSQLNHEFHARIHEITTPIESIYFGGGTPSLLSPEELGSLLEGPKKHTANQAVEITLEVNPEDLTETNLTAWQALGINRLSIGVQTMNDKLLAWMNRNHRGADTRNGMNLLQQYAFSVSIDLIFGVPQQTVADLEELLALIDAYPIEHVSAYALTQEPQTLLHHRVKTGKEPQLNDEQQVAHYHIIERALSARGFEHYEVSNYAKPGKTAIHNGNYWKGKPYLGMGPGAHSFDGVHTRRWNVSNNAQYLKQQDWFEEETLSADNQWNELWLTGLRTQHGVPTQSIEALGGLCTEEQQMLEILIKQEKIHVQHNSYCLTQDHWLAADGISMQLFRAE
jgi:oxygen-independent coproporphyrinogen III oxidase